MPFHEEEYSSSDPYYETDLIQHKRDLKDPAFKDFVAKDKHGKPTRVSSRGFWSGGKYHSYDTYGGSPLIDKSDIASALITIGIIAGPEVAAWVKKGLDSAGIGEAASAGNGAAVPEGADWLDTARNFGENLLKDNWKDLVKLGAGKLYDKFTETPREALEAEILQARRERLADLRRHAKGEFTPRERRDIRRANEHVLNRVATSLAMRGIQNSGAAGELIAQAEMAPFLQMQKQAQTQLDNYELKTYELAHKLIGEDDNFVTDLMDILFETDKKGDGNTDGTLKKVDDAATMIQTAYSLYSDLEDLAEELES